MAKRLADTEAAHADLINSIIKGEIADKRSRAQAALAKSEAAMKALPKPQRVYVGKVHTGGGAFRGTGHEGGKPRTIRVLHRGDMSQPRDEVGPGTLRLAKRDDGTFDLSGDHAESDRRVALARWLTKKRITRSHGVPSSTASGSTTSATASLRRPMTLARWEPDQPTHNYSTGWRQSSATTANRSRNYTGSS